MLMRRDSLLEWVRPPQQERSQRTLERLLDAAEAIILEEGVDAANVAAVAKRAKSSVGAFYARFPDKEALVRAVCERFAAQARATMDAVLQPARWEGQALEAVLGAGLRFMLHVARERRPLLAGLLIYASRDERLSATIDGLVSHFSACFQAFLAARAELPATANSDLTLSVLGGVLLSTVQGHAMRHPSHISPVTDSVLAEELTRLSLSYLRTNSL